jgi:predicted phosphodiesterase
MTLRRVGFIPDAHHPYHDKQAWKLMLKAMKAFTPDTVVVMGDLADFYAVSSHSKDPQRALQFVEEIGAVNKALDQLDALGADRKIFISGNHCDRLTRFIQDRAPELNRVVGVPESFKLAERGWEYVPYKQNTKLGRLYLTHDVGTTGRGAVYKALDVFHHSVVTGHSHRLGYIVEGDATGGASVSAQFGHLLDVEQVDYMHKVRARRDWALGFGIGYHDTTTDFVYLVPIPIVEYTCVVEGRLYKV